jgi:DNA-binding transcriptional MerR regulator
MPNYTITELAREFDITPRAIRFYEDQGLISPKREGAGGRTRVYSGRERTRLKLTLRGKRLGLTLSEIKDLVDMYESPKDSTAQLKRFLAVLAQHRETLERQREDIEITLEEIAAHEAECRRLLDSDKGGAKSDGKSARPRAKAGANTTTARTAPRTRPKESA